MTTQSFPNNNPNTQGNTPALYGERWSPTVEAALYPTLLATELAENNTANVGNDEVLHVKTYGKSYSSSRHAGVDETFNTVDTRLDSIRAKRKRSDNFSITDDEKIIYEDFAGFLRERAMGQTQILRGDLDGDVLSNIAKAKYTFDDNVFSNVAGASDLTANTSLKPIETESLNIDNIIIEAGAVLRANDVYEENKRYLAIPEDIYGKVQERFADNVNTVGDAVLLHGQTSKNYRGIPVYVSNHLTHVTKLTYTDQPADGETFVINGVTITAKTTVDGENQFKLGANASATYTNLQHFFNKQSLPEIISDKVDVDLKAVIDGAGTDGDAGIFKSPAGLNYVGTDAEKDTSQRSASILYHVEAKLVTTDTANGVLTIRHKKGKPTASSTLANATYGASTADDERWFALCHLGIKKSLLFMVRGHGGKGIQTSHTNEIHQNNTDNYMAKIFYNSDLTLRRSEKLIQLPLLAKA